MNFTQAFRELEPCKISTNSKSSPQQNLLNDLLIWKYFANMKKKEFYIAYNPLFPPYRNNPSSTNSPKPIANKPF